MLNGSLSWKRNLLADVFFLHQVSVATSHPTLPFMLLFSISPCRDRRGGMQKHRRSTQSAGMEPCSTLQVAGWWFIFFYNIIYIYQGIYTVCVCTVYIVYIYCVFFHFANDLGGWPRLTNSLNWLWLEWFWRWVETCSRPCWNHQPGCCWWLRGCLWSAFAGPKEG